MALLELKKVDFAYYGSSFELNDVNLSLSSDERLVIYGSENSGKTTLLRVVCGLEKYSKGSILLDGIELNSISQKDMNIGFSFDSRALDKKALAREVISYPMELRGISSDNINAYLDVVSNRCDIPLNSQVKDLSDMQIANLILARLFSIQRRLYLVDDVWKDLPQDEKSQVTDYLIDIMSGKSVIIATDDTTLATKITTEKIVVLTDRQVAPMLTYEEIKSRPINMQSAIFAGYELHIGRLDRRNESYFAFLYGKHYAVSKPMSDVYVDKDVCFAIERSADCENSSRCIDDSQLDDANVMEFYYDLKSERIITK